MKTAAHGVVWPPLPIEFTRTKIMLDLTLHRPKNVSHARLLLAAVTPRRCLLTARTPAHTHFIHSISLSQWPAAVTSQVAHKQQAGV
jgi:hypothetical protein